MAQFFSIHPDNPQPRLIRQAAEIVRAGGIIVYPTDSCYALGCRLEDKAAMERIRALRQLTPRHPFTLACRDLAQAANYARVSDRDFRLLKAVTPGSYTFILRATREVPRRLQHPRRKTIGIRIPDHTVAQALLAQLGEPLITSTLLLPGDAAPLSDAQEIRRRLEHEVDVVLDSGPCGVLPTTMVNLTGEAPLITRTGRGSIEPFAVSP